MAADAKKATEEWGRRWFLSLAIGNAGGLAAVSSAILSIVTKPEQPDTILWALIPPAWLFAIGLVSGAVLPFCWLKRVEKISDWVWVREQELDDDGPTQIWVGEDDAELSSVLRDQYEAHKARWTTRFQYCERVSVAAFLSALLWAMLYFTIAQVCR